MHLYFLMYINFKRLFIYSVQKMILKFDLNLVVVDLVSHGWMWSKLNCFITSVVNWEMSEKQRKLCSIFYKMFKCIKRVSYLKEKKKNKKLSHHVS